MRLVQYVKLLPFIITISLILLFTLNVSYTEGDFVHDFIQHHRYFSVLLFSFSSGFILTLPIPAGVWIVYYLEAGLNYHVTLIFITVGVTIADSVSILLGSFLKNAADSRVPKITNTLMKIKERSKNIPPLLTFFWASFSPLPNEILIYPLTLLGYRFWHILVPLTLGNFVFSALITQAVWLVSEL